MTMHETCAEAWHSHHAGLWFAPAGSSMHSSIKHVGMRSTWAVPLRAPWSPHCTGANHSLHSTKLALCLWPNAAGSRHARMPDHFMPVDAPVLTATPRFPIEKTAGQGREGVCRPKKRSPGGGGGHALRARARGNPVFAQGVGLIPFAGVGNPPLGEPLDARPYLPRTTFYETATFLGPPNWRALTNLGFGYSNEQPHPHSRIQSIQEEAIR